MKLVIFDCDGTLADSQHLIVAAMEGAFAAQGHATPDRASVLKVVGLSLDSAIQRLLPVADARTVGALVESYKTIFGELRRDPANQEPLYPGAREVIDELSRRDGVALGIATGKGRRGVEHFLDRHGLASHFAMIETADTNPSKPHPSMILKAMARTGAAPESTVMIGDTAFDMVMALNAGVAAIGVTWGYHPVSDLVEAGAHEVVGDFPALGAALDRLLLQWEASA